MNNDNKEVMYEVYTNQSGINLLKKGVSALVWSNVYYDDGDFKIKVPYSSVLLFDKNGFPDAVSSKGVEFIEEDDSN